MADERLANLLAILAASGGPVSSKITAPKIPLPQVTPQQQNLSDYVLTHTSANADIAKLMESEPGGNDEEPGMLSKFFEYLSIPLHTSLNVVKDLQPSSYHEEGNSFLDDLGSEVKNIGMDIAGGGAALVDDASFKNPITLPLAGLDKGLEAIGQDPGKLQDKYNEPIYGHNLLEDVGVDNPWLKYGGGFAIDVLADPLTYVGGLGAFKRGAQAAHEGIDGLKGIEAFEKPALELPNTSITQDAVHGVKLPEKPWTTGVNPVPAEKLQRLSDRAGNMGLRKLLFHGSTRGLPKKLSPAKEIEVFNGQMFGSGLYTTDSYDLAMTYAEQRGGFSGFREFGPIDEIMGPGPDQKVFNFMNKVDNKTSDEFRNYLREKIPLDTREPTDWGWGPTYPYDHPQHVLDFFDEASANPLNNSWFDLVTLSEGPSFAQEFSNFLREKRGFDWGRYDGGVHTGRLKTHNAYVMLNPEKMTVAQKEVMDEVAKHHNTGGAPYSEISGNGPEAWQFNSRDLSMQRASAEDALKRYKIDFAEDMRSKRLRKAGLVSDGKGNISIHAIHDIVESIKNGDIPRFGERAVPAEGAVADAATKAADAYVSKWGAKLGKMSFSPPRQAVLFQKMLDAQKGLKIGKKAQLNTALSMLKTAEDHLIARGLNPVAHNGSGLRLSDIIAEVKPEMTPEGLKTFLADFARSDGKYLDLKVGTAIERAMARRSLSVADILGETREIATQEKSIIDSLPNLSDKIEHSKAVDGLIDEIASKTGLTRKEIKAAQSLSRNVVGGDTRLERLMAEYGPELKKASLNGKVSMQATEALNRAIETKLGMKFKTVAPKVINNKALESVMTRFTTWWGRQDVIRDFQKAFIFGQRNAEMRAQWLRNVVKKYDKKDVQEAFAYSQGRKTNIKPELEELAGHFKKFYDNMLDSTGLSKKAAEASVAARSQMLMDELNIHLKRVGAKFQFTNKKRVPDGQGIERDFSDTGEGWMKSWELADIGEADPASFMYNMDLAMERLTKEHAIMDDFAARWGSPVKTATHTAKVHNPRIEDYWFDPHYAGQMKRLQQLIDENMWRPKGEMMQMYSRGLRAWKTGVTIYLPSHHIRNAIGDIFLMWMAGHNNPKYFMQARRIMHSQRGMYKEALNNTEDGLSTLRQLSDPEAASWAATRGTDVILSRGGMKITADQLYTAAHQNGLLLDANLYEDIFGASTLGSWKPLGGRVHDTASAAAEYREHFIRLAHYSAAIDKRMAAGEKNLKNLFSSAADEVRKWHPDGRDMTKFEQNIRLALPFYSWTRKIIPLMVQSAVTRPAKITAYPKMMMNLQGLTGISDDPNMLDPFPDNQLFPYWIRESGIGPIGDTGDEETGGFWGAISKGGIDKFGGAFGYTSVNPSNPFNDTFSQFLGMGQGGDENGALAPGRGLLELLTPAARIPLELGQGHKISGQPISDDPWGYLSENIPLVAPVARVTNSFGPFETKDAERMGGSNFDIEALLNILTAAGIRGSGPYVKSAEFEAKERAKARRE